MPPFIRCASFILVSAAVTVYAQQPVRDEQRAATGTAALAGIVVSDESEPRPLRRARVMVNNAERTVGRTVVTEDTGAFVIADLPPGRYTLTATKDGSVTVTHGARRLGRPGTPIGLTDGQRIADLVLRIPRSAVVTGTLLDEHGQPLPGASVRLARSIVQNGERRFTPAGISPLTDDRGVYRVYGLMPGEYIVSAFAPMGQTPTTPDVRMVTDAEVQQAIKELRTPFASTRPGQADHNATSVASSTGEESATVAYAPIYYPGVMFPNQATRLTLAAGEERGGIDFQMQLVRTAKIEGTVVGPAGVSPQVTVNMLAGSHTMIVSMAGHFKTARADAQGRFSFTGISPGQYSLVTRGGPTGSQRANQPGSPQSPHPSYWAQADITVDGRDMTDVLLSLQPGMTVAGIVRFESSRLAPPADLSRMRVNLFSVQARGEVTLGVSPAQVDESGRFTIAGVTPGPYRIVSSVPGDGGAPSWFLKSAIANGQDALDARLDLQPTRPPGDIVLTFTDRPTELSGTIRDASGRPAPDYFIIAFTTDRAMWMPQSRRIQSVRPSADGSYTFRNLPPGEYLVGAVDDAEPGEWFDPAFLEALVESSIKVALGQGEQKTQDLTLAVGR